MPCPWTLLRKLRCGAQRRGSVAPAKPASRSRSKVVKAEPVAAAEGDAAEAKPKPTRSRTSRAKPKPEVAAESAAEPVVEAAGAEAVAVAPVETARVETVPVETAAVVVPVESPSFPVDPGLAPAAPETALLVDPDEAGAAVEPTEDDGTAKPKKRGWWSLGR